MFFLPRESRKIPNSIQQILSQYTVQHHCMFFLQTILITISFLFGDKQFYLCLNPIYSRSLVMRFELSQFFTWQLPTQDQLPVWILVSRHIVWGFPLKFLV